MDSKEYFEIYEYDETYIQIVAEKYLIQNLSDYFTFEIDNARFDPRVKNKLWDGKIRLLNRQNNTIYKGLLSKIIEYCRDNGYECHVADNLCMKPDFSKKVVDDFINSMQLAYEPYDFQKSSFMQCINEERLTLLSPTSSGKSFIIYLLLRWYLRSIKNKILITVPTTSLVKQLTQEFIEYDPSFKIDDHIHQIYSGKDKISDKKIIISTWQSVYSQKSKYFSIFDVIIADECHQAKASSIKGIFEKAKTTKHRFGLTGTLDGVKYNSLIIEGLCGKIVEVTDTKTLMDRGIVSNLKINGIILNYSDDTKQQFADSLKGLKASQKFSREVKFITEYEPRTKLICNVAKSITGANTLILTQSIDHIKKIEQQFVNTNKKVYVVHGTVDVDVREEIRRLTENNTDVIIIASYGVFSTGINIKNIQYIMFATSSKSQIRVLQSIGRGLRKDGKDNQITLLDIVDDLTFKGQRNYLLKHFLERIKIYAQQQFKYKIKKINVR